MPAKALQSLLPLLDLKVEGRTPGDLADTYVPIIDATPFFLQERHETANAGSLCPLQGFNPATIIVPQNEIWVMHHVDTYVSTPVTTFEEVWPAVTYANVSSIYVNHSCRSFTAGAAAMASWDGMAVIHPGSEFGFQCNLAGVGRVAELTIHFQRLTI